MERTNGGLAVVEPENGSALSVPQMQKAALTNASALAQDVAKIVRDNGLSKKFGSSPKEHVFVEGWLTISRVNNEAPHSKIEAVETHGDFEVIKARAWITDASGAVVSEADGYCSNEEANWKGKPFYARASMAQTRAIGKAMRLRHAWVMVMAGFSPTPAEEMDGVETAPHQEQRPRDTRPPLKITKKTDSAPREGDDAERVPASVTDAAAPTITPEQAEQQHNLTGDNMELVTVKAYSKPKDTSNGGKRWGILCIFADGSEDWRNTFSSTVAENAKKLKGKKAYLTLQEQNGYVNVTDLTEAAIG